jgi:hypothetical protein
LIDEQRIRAVMRPDVASASGHGIRSSTNRCGQIKAGCLGPEIWIGQINAGWHQASMRCGDRLAVDTGGYLFLACLTGIGGGTVRDLVLGREAVFWVGSPHYLGIACGAALIVLVVMAVLPRLRPRRVRPARRVRPVRRSTAVAEGERAVAEQRLDGKGNRPKGGEFPAAALVREEEAGSAVRRADRAEEDRIRASDAQRVQTPRIRAMPPKSSIAITR